MTDDDFELARQMAHLLSSSSRLRIVEVLLDHPEGLTQQDLADSLEVARQSLTRPLKELRDLGILDVKALPPQYRPLLLSVAQPDLLRETLTRLQELHAGN